MQYHFPSSGTDTASGGVLLSGGRCYEDSWPANGDLDFNDQNIGAAACSRSPAPASQLKDVKAPPGFTFQNSHSVALQLTSSASLVPSGTAGHLTVARLDGTPLFDGGLTSDGVTKVRVPLPNTDSAVLATLVLANGSSLKKQIPVVANAIAYTFQ